MATYSTKPKKYSIGVVLLPGLLVLLVCLLLTISYLKSHRPPSINFPNGTFYDFGIANEGEFVSCPFVIKNCGGKPLQIKNVIHNCSCIGADVEKSTLLPGETTKVKVSYQARPTTRREILKVWIECNDPQKPITELTISGTIHLIVYWYPKSVSFYCEHGIYAQKKHVKFLIDNTKQSELGKITTSSERIEASWEEDNKGLKCVISLNPNCPVGSWVDIVNIQTLVGNNKRNIEIPVYLMIK